MQLPSLASPILIFWSKFLLNHIFQAKILPKFYEFSDTEYEMPFPSEKIGYYLLAPILRPHDSHINLMERAYA